jgi:hypothetical protein
MPSERDNGGGEQNAQEHQGNIRLDTHDNNGHQNKRSGAR